MSPPTKRILACLLASAAVSAQEPEPGRLPVTALAPASTTPPLRFVALARERGPKPKADGSDMQATIWDIPVGEPAVRRVVLGCSPWSPTPLLDSACLLRWQLPATAGTPGPYRVEILAVDYADFRVRKLFAAPQATALGGSGDRVYLQTPTGQVLLHQSRAAVEPLQPTLAVLARHKDDWLVVVDGHLARFDAAKGELVRRYPDIEVGRSERQLAVDWDGGRWAVGLGRFFDEGGELLPALAFQRWSLVQRELRVWDLDAGAGSQLRTRIPARGGSGRGVLPLAMPTELVGGMLRYVEWKPATQLPATAAGFDWARDAEWVTIDIANGKQLLRAPYRPREPTAAAADPMQLNRVPDYLRQRYADSPIHGCSWMRAASAGSTPCAAPPTARSCWCCIAARSSWLTWRRRRSPGGRRPKPWATRPSSCSPWRCADAPAPARRRALLHRRLAAAGAGP